MAEVPLIGAKREPEEPVVIQAKTAFILYLLEDGSVGLSNDLDAPITVEGLPSQNDVWTAVSSVKRNIEATEIAAQAAQMTLSAQMQLGQQIMMQQQNQGLVEQLGPLR